MLALTGVKLYSQNSPPLLQIIVIPFIIPTVSLAAEKQFRVMMLPLVLLTENDCSIGITKTSPCNEHPLTPHFYIVKLGFTGVYIFVYFCSKT